MELDGRTIAPNQLLQADICIIGAGTAGITLAHTFINKKCDVLLLESGGLKPDKQSQLLSYGENIGHPYFSLDTARPRGLGGSTNRWLLLLGDNQFGARMRPLDSIDFEKRDEIPYSGWPFTKESLDSYYTRAEAFCKIIPQGFKLEDWIDSKKNPPLPLDPEIIKTVIFKFGSKDPFLKTYAEEIRNSNNVKLVFHSTAIDIEANEDVNSILKIHATGPGYNKFEVAAKIYVLACGAIEIARLMLSSNKQQNSGLGNQNDLVGRFFMEHLHFYSGFFIPDDQNLSIKTTLYNEIHNVNDVPIIGKLALNDTVLRSEKLSNYVLQIKPLLSPFTEILEQKYPAIESAGVHSMRSLLYSCKKADKNIFSDIKNIISDRDNVSKTVFRKILKKFYLSFSNKMIKLYSLHHMSEQVPNPISKISLSHEKDAFNINRVCVNWCLSSVDIISAIRSQQIIAGEFVKTGLGKLYVVMKDEMTPHPVTGGWHHMGTTRMSDSVKHGVVDPSCRVNNISNLYIAGPSVFPTGGYANPCLTIVAMTLKLSDHLKVTYEIF
jgi:choline dehydrogenase-like flavoprotein